MSSIKHFSSIKSTKEFNRVYRNSKTVHTSQFVLFYQFCKDEYSIGVVASKKVGNAVHRNRAKRLLRSHLINYIDNLNVGRYILVAKPLLLSSNYQHIDKQFFNALRRVKALKQ